jgi:hypothetical protein
MPIDWDAVDSAADPESATKRTYSKGHYEPQLGQAPKGNLPQKSILESLLRGGAQGASLGFADEMAGALKAATRFGSMPRAEDYRAGRDSYRAEDKLAEQSNPTTFGAADIAGTLATAPLSGAANTVKSAAATGAKLGGLLGLGKSESDLTQGDWTGNAVDTAKGAITGAVLGPLGLGLAKGVGAFGTKVGDTVRNLGWILGGKGAPSAGRALDTLGVEAGSAPNPRMQSLVDQKVVHPEDFPPSAFNRSSESAPDAIARIGKQPTIQVAEKEGVQASKAGLGAVEEMPWANNPDTVHALVELRRGIIPKGAATRSDPLGGGLQTVLAGIEKIAGTDKNLAKALSQPRIKAEMAQIIAAGRAPDLSSEAANALSSRALSLLGIDNLH